jgi:hypothetical protein
VFCLPADREERQRLLSWAAEFMPRVWAVKGATGTGALLLARRSWTCHQSWRHGCGCWTTTTATRPTLTTPARRRSSRFATTGCDRSASRIPPPCYGWAKRHHDLFAARTRAICRLHTTVTFLVEGTCPADSGPNGQQPSWPGSNRPQSSGLSTSRKTLSPPDSSHPVRASGAFRQHLLSPT